MADFTMDRFSLKGKTALVTGAERGIGLKLQRGWPRQVRISSSRV